MVRAMAKKGTSRPRSGLKTIRKSDRGYLRRGGNYGRYNKVSANTIQEMKYVDQVFTLAPTLASSNTDAVGLAVIPEGTGPSQRIGRKTWIKAIHLNGEIKLPPLTALTTGTGVVDSMRSERMRVMVLVDKQWNGAGSLNPDDVLQDGTSIDSFLNMENVGRYRILLDKRVDLNRLSASAVFDTPNILSYGNEVRRTFKFNIKCNVPIEYDGVTGSVTEQRTNSLHILVVTDSSILLAEFQGTARVRYHG